MAEIQFMLSSKIWPPAQITTSFEDKTIVVTGSNTGVGFQAALKFAELRASKVILAVRSLEKGKRAKEEIDRIIKRDNVVEVWELDMENYESIDAFAKRVDRELERLDVAVLNAGVVSRDYVLSPYGWEKTLQINTLSTALLAMLLLPKLKASKTSLSPAYLTIVSSTGHLNANLRTAEEKGLLQEYNTKEGYGAMDQYVISKLFMMWITRELAERCVGPDGEPRVVINDVCPGPCRSDIARDFTSNPVVSLIAKIVMFVFFRSAEQGSRTVVGASFLGKESNGKWWVNDTYKQPGKYITSDEGKEMQKQMWTESTTVLSKQSQVFPKLAAGAVDPLRFGLGAAYVATTQVHPEETVELLTDRI